MPRLKSRKRYKKTRRTRKRYKKTGGGEEAIRLREELREKAERLREESTILRAKATRLKNLKTTTNNVMFKRKSITGTKDPAPPPAPTNTQIKNAEKDAITAEKAATNAEQALKRLRTNELRLSLIDNSGQNVLKTPQIVNKKLNIQPLEPEFLQEAILNKEYIKKYLEFIEKKNDTFDNIVTFLNKEYETYIFIPEKIKNTTPSFINNTYFTNKRIRLVKTDNNPVFTNNTYAITHVPNKIPYTINTTDIDTLIRSLFKIVIVIKNNESYMKSLFNQYIKLLLDIIKEYKFVYNTYFAIWHISANYNKLSSENMPYIIEHGFREIYNSLNVPPQNLKATS